MAPDTRGAQARSVLAVSRAVLLGAWSAGLAVSLSAQTTPLSDPASFSVAENAPCAPTLTIVEPQASLRLVATQDPTRRLLYGPGDTLVVNAGSSAGLDPGQKYFVRRLPKRFGSRRPDRNHPVAVHTAGWIEIRSVGDVVATATVVHACDGMFPGDYLEPFVPPAVVASTPGQVRYDSMATILGGDEDRNLASANDFMIIDRGTDHGVGVGDWFVVVRDKHAPGAPLVAIGDGLVLMTGPQSSTVQITRARDGIRAGDLVAFRK